MLVRIGWLMLLSCVSVTGVYAQRVYATTGQISPKQTLLGGTLSEVQNPTYAYDTDYGNYATLVTNLGALGLIEAWENVQFESTKPTQYSPVFVQFSTNGSANVLDLLGTVTLQPTLAGALVGTAYSGTLLLTLLGGSYTENAVRMASVPAPGVTYDGVRLRITSVLSIGPTARYYYAFFIKPPTLSNVSACTGQTATLTVTNTQPGYQYAWFENQTGGTAVATTSGSYTTPALTSAKSYYVEAREGTTSYASARTKVDVSIYAKPVTPLVQLNH